MPQTRVVLKKAFESHVKPIVVVNKVDKPSARCSQVVDEVLDLSLIHISVFCFYHYQDVVNKIRYSLILASFYRYILALTKYLTP